MLMNGVFADIGIMIIGAALLGFLAKMFKQPLIPAYILAGLIFGPTGLQFVTDKEIIFMFQTAQRFLLHPVLCLFGHGADSGNHPVRDADALRFFVCKVPPISHD